MTRTATAKRNSRIHAHNRWAIASVFLLVGVAQPGELILVCRGDINAIGDVGWNKKDQTIAAQVKNDNISLTGNDFLGERDIRVCQSEPWGPPHDDELHFDTRGCGSGGQYDPRTYGRYNKILGNLDVTHTAEGLVITGRFKCKNRFL